MRHWLQEFLKHALCCVVATGLVVTIFLSGCSAPKNQQNEIVVPRIKKSADVFEIPCQRFSPSGDGSRAFFGVEVDASLPVVKGYFYCNSVSPAKNEGILIGDRIISVRNCPVTMSSEVKSLIEDTPLRTLSFVKVNRDGKILDFPVKPLVHKPMGQYFPSRNMHSKTCNIG